MRHRLLLLLLPAIAAAGEFELTLPKGDDWEARKPDGDSTKAFYETEFAESNPTAGAQVRVMTYPLGGDLLETGLDAIAREWAPTVESEFKEPKSVHEGAAKLGDKDAWFRDVRTDTARLTWHVARAGKVLFAFHVIRTNKACDDQDLEEEIAAMRATFRFLVKEEPDAHGPPKPPPFGEKEEPRATLRFDHWRFECVKPEGLVNVPPERFDDLERKSGVVAKFQRKARQSMIMVRVYAQAKSAQRFTLDQLVEQKLKRFEETYEKGKRQPPKRDDAIKFPMAERAFQLELVGRRTTTETTRWILAQCKNDRQYQIEIFVTGGDQGRWAAEIRDLLDGFRPLPG